MTGLTGCSNPFKIELLWPEQIATSKWFPPRVYLIFNCILALLFAAFQLENLADVIPVVGGFYFIYLTVWALVLETITMVMLFISTAWAYAKLPAVGALAELVVSSDQPFCFPHSVVLQELHLGCFLLAYLGYTVIHFLAEIGSPIGCELYIDPDPLLQRVPARTDLRMDFAHVERQARHLKYLEILEEIYNNLEKENLTKEEALQLRSELEGSM
eukprot:s1572_g18.t1